MGSCTRIKEKKTFDFWEGSKHLHDGFRWEQARSSNSLSAATAALAAATSTEDGCLARVRTGRVAEGRGEIENRGERRDEIVRERGERIRLQA